MAYSFIDYYVKFEYKFRYFILIFWLLCLIFGIVFGFNVLQETVNEVLPPSGSQADAAQDLSNELFPGISAKQSTIHYFHALNNKNVSEIACIQDATKQLYIQLNGTDGPKYIKEQFGIVSAYDKDGGPSAYAQGLLSEHGTLINFELDGTDAEIDNYFKDFESIVNKAVTDSCSKTELNSMIHGEIGLIKFSQDANDNALDDLQVMDSICLPISAVILIIMLRSIRLVLITVFATGSSILTSFLFLYPIAKYAMDVTTMAPTMMMALCLAISIDYSLFLLSRFRQELQKGELIGRAIYATTFYAGRIVLLSGSILSLCFFSNMFLGNNMLLSMGFAAGFAAMFNFTANMMVVPAMLFVFPRFFSDFSYFGLGTCLSRFCLNEETQRKLNYVQAGEFRTDREVIMESDEYKKALEDPTSIKYEPVAKPGGNRWDGTGTDAEEPSNGSNKEVEMGEASGQVSSEYPNDHSTEESSENEKKPEEQTEEDKEHKAYMLALLQLQRKGVWYNCSRCSTCFPLNIVTIAIIVLCIVPFAVFYFQMEESLDNTQSFSQNSLTTKLFNALGSDFSQGMLSPIDIVFDCRDLAGESCWTEGFFCWAQDFIEQFVDKFHYFESDGKNITACDVNDFNSPVMLQGNRLPFQFAQMLSLDKSSFDATVENLLTTTLSSLTDLQKCKFKIIMAGMYEPYKYVIHRTVSQITATTENPYKVAGMKFSLSTQLNPMGSDVYEVMPDYYDFAEDYIKNHKGPDDYNEGCSFGAGSTDIATMLAPFFDQVPDALCTQPGGANAGQTPFILPRFTRPSNITTSIINTTTSSKKSSKKPSISFQPLRAAKYPYYSTKSKMHMGYAGSEVTQIDGVRSVFTKLPMAMAITLVIIFLVVAVIFRSIVIPIRTVVTVFLTICFSLGLCTVVFQYHVLKYAIPYLEDFDTLYYFVPIFGYSIIIGFSLDYDIFLFYRVAEFRDKGYTDRAAILKASAQAQATISAAGLIMSVAFFGLMFSKMAVMVEFGFLLFMTIIVETFIIVPLLVTAICSLLGPFLWWPGKRIHATKTADDMSDQLPEVSTDDGTVKKGITCLRADPYTIDEWNKWMGFLPRKDDDTDESYEQKRMKCGCLMTAQEVIIGLYGEKCLAGIKAKQAAEAAAAAAAAAPQEEENASPSEEEQPADEQKEGEGEEQEQEQTNQPAEEGEGQEEAAQNEQSPEPQPEAEAEEQTDPDPEQQQQYNPQDEEPQEQQEEEPQDL